LQRIKVKFCGLKRQQDIETVNQLLPEYVGFMFYPKSKRYVSAEQAKELKKCLDPSIQAVGVFVNESSHFIAQYLEQGIIDIVQLHGQETEEQIAELQQLTGRPIWKAFSVQTMEDVAKAENSCADNILLDSGAGGTGTVFSWELLENIHRPFFLAGGLNIHNVGEAIQKLHPMAVDVSSGIETDGWKDSQKMELFINQVRNGKKSKIY